MVPSLGTPAGRRLTRPRPGADTTAASRCPRRTPARIAAAGPAFLLLAIACGDGSTGPPAVVPAAPVAPVAPAAPAPAPSISRLSSQAGSTLGTTPLSILGTGFQAGATVTFGGVAAGSSFSNGMLHLSTPAHVAGAVDVVVTNPDGQTTTAAGAFTYAEPDGFDFNGSWIGSGPDDDSYFDLNIGFTIRDGELVSIWCEGEPFVASPLSSLAVVRNGEFTYVSPDSTFVASGRIVAPGMVLGTVTAGHCAPLSWTASKDKG